MPRRGLGGAAAAVALLAAAAWRAARPWAPACARASAARRGAASAAPSASCKGSGFIRWPRTWIEKEFDRNCTASPSWESLTRTQLRAQLARRGLNATGGWAELVARLQGSDRTYAPGNTLVWPKVGDTVEVKWAGVWYKCHVLEVNTADGTCMVKYADGGDEEPDIEIATRVRRVQGAWVRVGMSVEVSHDDGWYAGTVIQVTGDGKSCSVAYASGEVEHNVEVATHLRKLAPEGVFEGMFVEVEQSGTWYDCDVVQLSEDGSHCTVRYFEGGEEECDVDIASRVRTPRMPSYGLDVGQLQRGIIRSIYPEGAFVDIGAEQDGFLATSRITRGFSGCVRDLLDLDFEVDVWICGICTKSGRLELTMVEGWVGGNFGGKPPPGFPMFRNYLLHRRRVWPQRRTS